MQESCSCGASVKARRRHVIAWREQHACNATAEPEPDKQGSFSQAEHAGHRAYEHGESSKVHDFPIVVARMGFTPNP